MTRLVVHIEARNEEIALLVMEMEKFAAEWGLAKMHAGYLPGGTPAGYIYKGGASKIRLLLLPMAQRPYVKIDHQGDELAESLVLQSTLKRLLLDLYPERCKVISDWERGAEANDGE